MEKVVVSLWVTGTEALSRPAMHARRLRAKHVATCDMERNGRDKSSDYEVNGTRSHVIYTLCRRGSYNEGGALA